MNRLVLIGAGNIGFRHLQAACSTPTIKEITVIEPNSNRLQKALQTAELAGKKTSGFPSLNADTISGKVDCLISATTTEVQYANRSLYRKIEPRFILLEKPISQSMSKLNELIEGLSGNSQIYVNCARNIGLGIQEIKNSTRGKRIHIEVFGNNWGLGCNMVHFIELFRFLTDSKKVTVKNASITNSPYPNKRGAQYEEFLGSAAFFNEHGDSLQVTCGAYDSQSSGISLLLKEKQNDSALFLIEEKTRTFSNLSTMTKKPLGDYFVSESTRIFLESILNKTEIENLHFPTLREAKTSHIAYFEALTLALHRDDYKVT
jgi:hypothetical protein